MKVPRYAFVFVLGALICGTGRTQSPTQTVRWTAGLASSAAVKPGARATVAIAAEVQPGWHVYALVQRPGGPTALRVKLDENPIARAADAPTGSAAQRRYDPSFNLETQFYAGSFTLRLPLHLNAGVGAGRYQLPVSVRFQTCNGRECEPPTTIHLAVPIEVLSGA